MNKTHEHWATWKYPETLMVYAPPQICIEHLLLLTNSDDYTFMIAYHHSAGRYTYQVCTTLALETNGHTHYQPISMMEGEIVPDSQDVRCSTITMRARSQHIPIGLMPRVIAPIVLVVCGLLIGLSLMHPYWQLIVSIGSLVVALTWMTLAKRIRRIDTRGIAQIREHIRDLQWKSLYVQDAVFMSADDYARHLQAQNVR